MVAPEVLHSKLLSRRWPSKTVLEKRLRSYLTKMNIAQFNQETLTDEEVDALTRLLDLADNPLMDLILARAEPEGEVDLPHVRALLARLRQA